MPIFHNNLKTPIMRREIQLANAVVKLPLRASHQIEPKKSKIVPYSKICPKKTAAFALDWVFLQNEALSQSLQQWGHSWSYQNYPPHKTSPTAPYLFNKRTHPAQSPTSHPLFQLDIELHRFHPAAILAYRKCDASMISFFLDPKTLSALWLLLQLLLAWAINIFHIVDIVIVV